MIRKQKQSFDFRIDRLQLGNFGNCKSVGDGIFELKIDYGPGYRIYFSKIKRQAVILLSAGDKSTQSGDLKKAKLYLDDYKIREQI